MYRVTKQDVDYALGAVEKLLEEVKFSMAEEFYEPKSFDGLGEAVKELELKWSSYLSSHQPM